MKSQNRKVEKSHILMFLLFLIVLGGSAFKPLSYINWSLEALPSILLVLILVLTYKKFKFSNFTYTSTLIYSIIALIGAKYTSGIGAIFAYYTHLTYFSAGFALAALVKEFTLKKNYLKRTDIQYYIMIGIAVSAIQLYATISFTVASIVNAPGYTELSYNQFRSSMVWEFFLSLIGAIVAITVFKKIHDKEIE